MKNFEQVAQRWDGVNQKLMANTATYLKAKRFSADLSGAQSLKNRTDAGVDD